MSFTPPHVTPFHVGFTRDVADIRMYMSNLDGTTRVLDQGVDDREKKGERELTKSFHKHTKLQGNPSEWS